MSTMIETIEECGLVDVDRAINVLIERGFSVGIDHKFKGVMGILVDQTFIPYADRFGHFLDVENVDDFIGEKVFGV